MRIGYGKLGRSWNLDKSTASTVGGDIDVARALHRLAVARPSDEFVLVGRCRGGDPTDLGYPPNVHNPWHSEGWHMSNISAGDDGNVFRPTEDFRSFTKDLKLDAVILWLGQISPAASRIPNSGSDWDDPANLTNPQVSACNYTMYLIDLCNRLEIEPILLCPDPRNYWKPRELIRPLTSPILAQYNMLRTTKHEQYNEWGKPWQEGLPRTGSQIVAETRYVYAGIELTALDDPSSIECSQDVDRQHTFGVITNENAANVPDDASRLIQLQKYVLSEWPDAPIFGKWSDQSMEKLGRTIEPVPYVDMYPTLRSFKFTMTFPASGSGWATAKPWEAFAVGTPMFFHPKYDEQGHILPRTGKFWRKLRKTLIVHNQRQLWTRVKQMNEDDGLYRGVIQMQRQLYEDRFEDWWGGVAGILNMLEGRPWCGVQSII